MTPTELDEGRYTAPVKFVLQCLVTSENENHKFKTHLLNAGRCMFVTTSVLHIRFQLHIKIKQKSKTRIKQNSIKIYRYCK